MGVAGSGKSVVGRGIAAALARPFIDADDLHPGTNIDKMRRGEPLDDIDRAPWLDAVGAALAGDPGPVWLQRQIWSRPIGAYDWHAAKISLHLHAPILS